VLCVVILSLFWFETVFPLNVPVNAFIMMELRRLEQLLAALKEHDLAKKSATLAAQIKEGIESAAGSGVLYLVVVFHCL
jgi:meiotically up-regulated gene 157 (Mug157) protein